MQDETYRIASNVNGVTLIELLIVVVIIGILAAIAIPNFVSYRQQSYNSTAQSDLKSAMTSQEAYFIDNARYAGDSGRVAGAGYVASTRRSIRTWTRSSRPAAATCRAASESLPLTAIAIAGTTTPIVVRSADSRTWPT